MLTFLAGWMIRRSTPLYPNQIRYLRKFLQMDLAEAGRRLGNVSVKQIKVWESSGKMTAKHEKMLRSMVNGKLDDRANE